MVRACQSKTSLIAGNSCEVLGTVKCNNSKNRDNQQPRLIDYNK